MYGPSRCRKKRSSPWEDIISMWSWLSRNGRGDTDCKGRLDSSSSKDTSQCALVFQHNNPSCAANLSCAAMAIKVEHNNGLATSILCLLHMSTHTQIPYAFLKPTTLWCPVPPSLAVWCPHRGPSLHTVLVVWFESLVLPTSLPGCIPTHPLLPWIYQRNKIRVVCEETNWTHITVESSCRAIPPPLYATVWCI